MKCPPLSRVGQQIPQGPFPAAFLCFNGHRTGNRDGERNPCSQTSHPFPAQLLLHIFTDVWRPLWSEALPPGTNQPLCAAPGGRRSLRTGCYPVTRQRRHSQTPSRKPTSLWKLDAIHFFPRGRSCLWFSVSCWGSITRSGQDGSSQPPQLQLCGRRDGQADWVGCSPFPGQTGVLGKAFPSLRQAAARDGLPASWV